MKSCLGGCCAQTLQGSCYSAVSQRHVSTFRSETVGLRHHPTRQTGASKHFLLPFQTHNNNSLIRPPYHISHIFIYSPLKRAGTSTSRHDIRKKKNKKPSGSRYGISPRPPLQQIETAKTSTGDTFFHFSPLSPRRLLLLC